MTYYMERANQNHENIKLLFSGFFVYKAIYDLLKATTKFKLAGKSKIVTEVKLFILLRCIKYAFEKPPLFINVYRHVTEMRKSMIDFVNFGMDL